MCNICINNNLTYTCNIRKFLVLFSRFVWKQLIDCLIDDMLFNAVYQQCFSYIAEFSAPTHAFLELL